MKKRNKTILPSLLLGLTGLICSQVSIAGDKHDSGHKHNPHIHVDHEHGKITSQPVFKNEFSNKKKIKQVVPKNLIPDAPILNAEQAMKSFQLPDGFEIETIAAEPMVFDPVIALYDSKGRLWVVEMTTYMPDIEGNGEMEHESQIVVLTDINNDGKMDKRRVMLEKLLLPRTLAFVDQGILWADHTTLHFTELSEKDGQLSVVKTEVVDKKYAAGGSVEHKPNGMLFSLDNWYYNAYTTKRYRPYPLAMEAPKGSVEVYRNKYWKMVKQDSEFRGQWGLTQDDYGRHYFNGNSSPIRTTSFLPNVANRNAKHQFPVDLLEQDVGTPDVYPIRVTPGLYAGDQKGTYNDYKQARHTSACGTLIYRGNQFPKEYYGIGLVSEPTANLIKATKVSDIDGVVSGKNLFNKQSLLASTDERFRPVNSVNSPDGTITVVDFYHGIIQHGKFMTPYLHDQIKQRDLERHKHIGRIYRIKSQHKQVKNIRDLSTLSNQELVTLLGHDNGWHRDMAKQLLVMKQDKSLVSALTKVAINDNNHLAKINALWILESFNALSLALLEKAATNGNEKVKTTIYRLAEQLPTTKQLTNWLVKQSKNVSKEASDNLALVASVHKVWPALTNIINQYQHNDFVLAGLGGNEAAYLKTQANKIPEASKAQITKVMNFVDVTKGKKKLSGRGLNYVKLGQILYNGKAGCAGCHGANGEGNKTVPPLNKSEWVTGNRAKLLAIILHGLTGPIKVNGKLYDSGQMMPPLKHNSALSRNDIASVASYIRYAWANEAPSVTKMHVKRFNEYVDNNSEPFTVETLNKLNEDVTKKKK